MKRQGSKRVALRAGFVGAGVLVALAGVLFALTPVTAQGSGSAQAVLYEVLENPPPRPSTQDNVGAFVPDPLEGTLTRLAQATLAGSVLAAGGSLASWAGAEVEIFAQSRVDLSTGVGVGPIFGSFTVDTVGGTGSISGKISGTLDLSEFMTTGLAPTEGFWETLGKARLGGEFEGVAQVPFPCWLTFCYAYDPVTFATPDPLDPNEFKDGVPLVRFLIGFAAL